MTRTTFLILVVAVSIYTALFWTAGSKASVDVNGTRYHYLDDSQMVTMRYARNLADGYGPVWNRGGERVEGRASSGWMLVMAAVHALGASDADASLWIRVINWILGCVVLALVARILLSLGLSSRLLVATALLTLALTRDLLFWSINGFGTTLVTVVLLTAVLFGARRGRTLAAFAVLLFPAFAYFGDAFPTARSLAALTPVLMIVSVMVIAHLTERERRARFVMAAALAFSTVFNAGVSGRESFAALVSTQADPYANTVAGVMLKGTALKDSTVLVAGAGCLPYFSHLRTLELGVDVDSSLRARPDFVAGMVRQELAAQPREILATMLPDPHVDPVAVLMLNDTFIDEYRDQVVPVPFLLQRNTLFVHRDSPERARLAEWRTLDAVEP